MPPLKSKRPESQNSSALSLEIFILAGGKSSRMGRDKSRLKAGRITLLSRIQETAQATGLPVRILRRDVIAHCGPLSGIYTALTKSSADAVLFLACDMPLVLPRLLQKIINHFAKERRPIFTKTESAGFPFILPKTTLELVQSQISAGELSLRSLARRSRAQVFSPNATEIAQLFNVNAPGDWEKVRKELHT